MGRYSRNSITTGDIIGDLPELHAPASRDAPSIRAQFHRDKTWHPLPELKLDDGSKLSLFAVYELAEVKQVWKQFQRTAWHTPFQDFEWVNSWFECTSQGLEAKPCIILGYLGPELQFILPLASEAYYGLKRLLWLANEVNDYNCPLIKTGFLPQMTEKTVADIFTRIGNYVTSIDVYCLTKQPKYLAGYTNPFLGAGVRPASCDSHILKLDRNWPRLYAKQRSAKSRARLRQKTSRLKREGCLRFMAIRDSEHRQVAIGTILQWKSEQLERNGDRNPFDRRSPDPCSEPVLQQTIKKFADADATINSLRVYGLFLDDRLIAGMVAFVSPKTFSLFTSSYGPEVFPNCSAGTILLVKTIELAARAGLLHYDFLAGDEPYKLTWCDQRLGLYDCVFGRTAKGQLGVLSSILKLELKKSLKANAPAMAVLKQANRSRIHALGFLDRMQGISTNTDAPASLMNKKLPITDVAPKR